MSWSARGGILRPGVPPRIILKKVRADSEVFGLWRVRFPPCLVRPGRRLPVQGLSEGSLGCPGYPRNLVTGSLVFGPGVSLLARDFFGLSKVGAFKFAWTLVFGGCAFLPFLDFGAYAFLPPSLGPPGDCPWRH